MTGETVNSPDHSHRLDWTEICAQAAKVVTFIDLAGHEKYLKTTVFGLTGHMPDYAMLIIGANAGLVGMCKEHLGLALALNVPVIVVVTKIDMCPPNVLKVRVAATRAAVDRERARTRVRVCVCVCVRVCA